MLFAFGVVRSTTSIAFLPVVWHFRFLFWSHIKVYDTETKERVLRDTVKRETMIYIRFLFLLSLNQTVHLQNHIYEGMLYAEVNFLCLGISRQSLWQRGPAHQVRTSVVDASMILITLFFFSSC